jgi:hypothetical protein
MHFLREPADNFIGDLFPGLALIQPAFDVLIKISNDPVVTVIYDLKFYTTVITDAYLFSISCNALYMILAWE